MQISYFGQHICLPNDKHSLTFNIILIFVIIQPLQPDVAGCGKPSDHSVPVAIPYTDTSQLRKKDFELKLVRPIPEYKLISLGKCITNEKFTDVRLSSNPSSVP